MTQHPDNVLASCRVCGAGSGHPCFTQDGETAERVHHGRVSRSIEAALDPTFPRPLTPEQKAERWNRLIEGEDTVKIRIAEALTPTNRTDGKVEDFDHLVGQLAAEENPRPRSLKIHYRHPRLADTERHPTRWADAQRAPRIPAACGGYYPPDRVTDRPETVDCERCLQYAPPTPDTLAAMLAQLDEAMQERR
jgi:hypothetical protein